MLKLFLVLLMMIASCPAFCAQPPDMHVTAGLVANVSGVRPENQFQVGVALKMEPGWHTYYKESGEAGMPTRVHWLLPAGFKVGELHWQQPQKFTDAGIVTYGYENETVISAIVTPPRQIKDRSIRVGAQVKWLACKDLCVPGGAKLEMVLPVVKENQSINNALFAFTPYDVSGQSILNLPIKIQGTNYAGGLQSLWMFIPFAFLGGLILNLMPCVLPVISIKILSLVQQTGDDRRRIFLQGLVFAAGIVCSFLVLAVLVIALKGAGQSVGWGFQFQYPGFLLAMALIVLVLALSLFGWFYVSLPGANAVGSLANQEGLLGSFFKGVLATILATPCTAPFLGTAVGFAFVQSAPITLTIFMTVGLGMAAPYMVLAVNPAWTKFIPRPGIWMQTLKEVMGFILLGTVVWLLWILGQETGVGGVTNSLVFLLLAAFGAWLIGRFTDLSSSRTRLVVVWLTALLIVIVGYFFTVAGIVFPTKSPASAIGEMSTHQAIVWERFSLDKLNAVLTNHKTVFLDFTANWCLTCQANEKLTLSDAVVTEKLKSLQVIAMKADWTKQDPEITKLLKKFGRSGVPLYVIFPADHPEAPIVLPEVVTPQIVLEALQKAGPSRLD